MLNFVRLSILKLRFKKMEQQIMSKHNANGNVIQDLPISSLE